MTLEIGKMYYLRDIDDHQSKWSLWKENTCKTRICFLEFKKPFLVVVNNRIPPPKNPDNLPRLSKFFHSAKIVGSQFFGWILVVPDMENWFSEYTENGIVEETHEKQVQVVS
jgi:hypothetical protein